MTHKTHRRFLFIVIMLLMALSIINTGPQSRAAVQQTCEECRADCDTWYNNCVAAGRPDCIRGKWRCYFTCTMC